MVAVFSTFATLSVVSMQQQGVGLAVAIFLDATIVRGLLVPAVMSVLGEHDYPSRAGHLHLGVTTNRPARVIDNVCRHRAESG